MQSISVSDIPEDEWQTPGCARGEEGVSERMIDLLDGGLSTLC